jgi:2-deoxy-D-gluconate 3-dehydrogenase
MNLPEMFDLTGKKALITGGSRGIGRAAAQALHECGAELVIMARSDELFDAAKTLGANGPKVHAVKADLSDRAQRKSAFDEAVQKLGTLDILINCAGISNGASTNDYPIEEWDMTLEVNLTAVFELSRLAAGVMLGKGGGKIINTGSLHSFLGKRCTAAYAASKGGVVLLTKSMAHEWAPGGINVNAVIPGFIDTAISAGLRNDPEEYLKTLDRLPMGRWGTPDDLKGAYVFLASRASDYITGAMLAVDGGILAI